MIKKEMEEETPRPPEVQPSCCRSETATVVLLLFGIGFQERRILLSGVRDR